MTWLTFFLFLMVVYLILVASFRRSARRHLVSGSAVILIAGLAAVKDQWGTSAPGTWFEKSEYKAVVLLHMKMAKSPFIEKIEPAFIKAKMTGGGDLFGPVIRTYRLTHLEGDPIDGIVLLKVGAPVRITDKSTTVWDVSLLPGDPLSSLPDKTWSD